MIKWKNLRAVITICVALGWWGIWFPELALWTESFQVVQEESETGAQTELAEESEASFQAKKNSAEYRNAREVYKGLLAADKEQIHLKSRLLELAEEYFKKVRKQK